MTVEPNAAASDGPWPGWQTQIVDGRFPLRRWLGGSDHSQVFLTEHRLHEAAIKLVPAELVSSPAQLKRWRAAMGLEHPHLLTLFDCGRCHLHEREYLYVLMEYAGETLAEILPARALTAEEVQGLLTPVLDALAYLHERQWVHGRVQPTNILVVGDQIKLAGDTVLRAGDRSEPTRASLYDAPDAASRLSASGDLWALGVTLTEALTQHAPLPSPGAEAPSLPDDVPAPLADLIRRCLNPNAAARPTAPTLWSELTHQPRPPPPAPAAPGTRATPSSTQASAPPESSGGQPLRAAPRESRVPAGSRPRPWWPGLAALGAFALIGWFALHAAFHAPSGRRRATADTAVAGVQPPAASLTPSAAGAAAPAPVRPVSPSTSQAPPAPSTGSESSGTGGVRHEELPRVPQSSLATIHGHFEVIVRVAVNDDGQVADASLEHAGPSAYFARLSLQAARGWRFEHAPAAGARDWRLVFQYSRDGVTAQARPSRTEAAR